MGGYGLYVWGSYGVTFVLLGIVVLVLAFIILNFLTRMRRQKSRVRY